MKQNNTLYIIIIFLLVIIGFGGAYFLGTQKSKPVVQTPSSIIASITQEPQVTEPTLAPTVNPTPTTETEPESGLNTYTNQEYGFTISYPDGFQALSDSNNLYGWPNGVVLLYKGGQSYDLVIEVWDNAADYQSKYPAGTYDLTVKEVNGKFITLLNTNNDPEVTQIINSFQQL